MGRSIFAALALGLSAPALAGQPAPATAQERLDPAALQAARDLLEATDYLNQAQAMTDQITDAALDMMSQRFQREQGTPMPPSLDRDLRRVVREHNGAVIEAMRPHLLEDAARVYARYFTAAEIRELQRLQTNPVMLKFQRIAPQFIGEVMRGSMERASALQPQLERRIREAIEAWLRQNRPGPAPRS